MIFGDRTVEPFADKNAAGSAEAFPFSADTSGNATSITVYVTGASKAGWLIAGLYSDNGGRPGSRIVTGSLNSPTASAWNTVEIASTAISSGKTYWVAVLGKGGALAFRDRSGGTCNSQNSYQTTLTSLPSSWKSGAHWPTCPISAFVSGTASTQSQQPGSSLTALAPIALSSPTITGTAAYGQTLTTSDGGWLDSPTSYSYQWQDCNTLGLLCTNIAGATQSTYTVGAGDVGNTIRSVVTAGNAAGSASSPSAQTSTVAQPPAPTAAFGFSPSAPQTGQNVHFDGSISTCAATPCSYAWTNGATSIGSGQSLDATFSNAGTQHVTLTVTDALNQTDSAEHDVAVTQAAPSAPTNTAAPAISGTAQQGQTLNVSNGSWTGNPTSFAYKWEDCNSSGASCTIISGATGNNYTLTANDVGSTIRAIVTATNAGGTNSATSAATAAVTASGGGGGGGGGGTTPKNCAVMGSNNQPNPAGLDACGYPSPNTTGVPAGTTLTPVASAKLPAGATWSGGVLTIGGNGTVVSGLDINGTVNVTGTNDQLNSSRVTCGSGADCITIPQAKGSSFSDDTVEGTGNTGNSLCIRAIHMEGDVSTTVKRVYITSCTDGVVGLSNTSDSYININGVYNGPSGSTHDEPIYLPGGNTTSADIEHNTLVISTNQVAAVFGDDHAYGPLHNVTINNNLLASSGSNGFVATGKAGDGNSGIVITNNRFSYVFGSNSTGGNAPAPATSWSGNYRDDTLATVAFQ